MYAVGVDVGSNREDIQQLYQEIGIARYDRQHIVSELVRIQSEIAPKITKIAFSVPSESCGTCRITRAKVNLAQ